MHYLLPLVPGFALCLARAVDGIENFNGEKAHRLFAACIGLIACVLIVVPFLNDYWQWQEELSKLSPLWGVVLALCAAGLWLNKASTPLESAFNICVGALVLSMVLSAGFFGIRGTRYDMTQPARKIAALLAQNKDVVYFRKYHGQFNFPGRLEHGLVRIDDATAWARKHPEGFIVVVFKDKKDLPDELFFYQHPFRNRVMALVPAKSLLQNERMLSIF